MAVWQATFPFASTAGFPPDFRARLGAIAPSLPSWAPDLEMWGSEDGNRVDVECDGGQPVEARVRFDLRTPAESFVIGIIAFVRAAHTTLLTETGLEVPPELASLQAALEGSRAARFVENPARYFNRLLAGGLDDV